MLSSWRILRLSMLGLLPFAGAWGGGQNPASGHDSTSRTITVTIDSPVDGSTVPAGPVTLRGRVEYSGPAAVDAAIVYAVQDSIDVSKPIDGDCNGDGLVDARDDLDHDGFAGSQRDCDLAAQAALDAALPRSLRLVTGAVQFGQGLVQLADLDPAPATLNYFAPAGTDIDGNGVPDVIDATTRQISTGAGSLDDALRGVQAEFEWRQVRDPAIVLLLSSGPTAGFTTDGSSPLAALAQRGAFVHAYAIGNPAGCDAGAPLRVIADTTGGTCTVATNPSAIRPPAIAAAPTRGAYWHGNGIFVGPLLPDADGSYSLTRDFPGGPTGVGLWVYEGQQLLVTAGVSFFVADSTPDPLHFADRSGVPGGTSIISETIWPSGFNVPVPIGVAGGRYSLNGQPYTDAAGMLAPTQSLTLQLQSSVAGGAQAVATVNVGGVTGRFVVTTVVDQSPDPFQFPEQRLRLPGVTYRSNTITIHGINLATPIAIGGSAEALYSVNRGPFTRTPGLVRDGDTVQLSNRIPLIGSLASRLSATATLTVGDYVASWRIGPGSTSP